MDAARSGAPDAILLLTCLNEVIAGFLVVIPAVDTLARRGRDLREGRWIALHGLAVPAVLLFLELVVNRHLVGATVAGPGSELEGASHLKMLIYYVTRNDFSFSTFYAFLTNRLFFSVAAPTYVTTLASDAWPKYTGYFEPAIANYFSSPVSAGLVASFGVIMVASALPKRGAEGGDALAAIFAAVLAYAVLRGLFWFVITVRVHSFQPAGDAGAPAAGRHTVCRLEAAGQAGGTCRLRVAPLHHQRHLRHRPMIAAPQLPA